MNKQKGLIIIPSLTVLLAVCLYFISFKFFIVLSFPEKDLKAFLTEFFMQNFNKAVQFENVYIDVFGNLVIDNFEVSITSDFNDNINLVKSRKTIVGLDFYKIIRKKILVNNIKFENSDITIFKRYGKNYSENFKEIFITDINLSNLSDIDLSNLEIEIYNSKIFYKEIFRDDRLTVVFEDVYSRIDIAKTRISYYIKGVIKPFKSAEIDRGDLLLQGELIFKENHELYISNTSIVIDNFDLSYMNSFIPFYFKTPFFLYGGFSPDLRIRTVNKNISVDGNIDINNLSLKVEGDSGSFNIVSNENISSRILLDILNDFNRILIRKFQISDENVKLTLNGVYNKNEFERYFDINFKSNKIDLSELSNYVTPLKDVNYSGYLKIDGRIAYDLKNNMSKETSLSLNIDNLVLTDYAKGRKSYLLEKLNTDLKLGNDELIIDIVAKKDKSDLRVRGNSQIYNWHPLKSVTNISFFSKRLEIKLIYYLMRRALDSIYLKAYEDKDKGYEEIVFTQTPLGQIINNNILNIVLKVKRIIVANKASLSNLDITASLEKGSFKLRNFNMSGYDGDYSCMAVFYFNQYYPSFKIKGGVRNFNIGRFSKDSGIRGEFEGIMHVDLDFHTTAYRLAHLVENSIGEFHVEFVSGKLNSSEIQNRIVHFLEKNGYAHFGIDHLRFDRASLLFRQTGENFYVRNFHLFSDKIQFATHGKYSYATGLSIPVTVIIREIDENNRSKTTMVPLLIVGPLLSPELELRKKVQRGRGKETPHLRLFDIGY